MKLIDLVISREMKKKGYKPSEAKGVKKSDVLAELDPETVQLMAMIPKGTMDSVWRALGVEDE